MSTGLQHPLLSSPAPALVCREERAVVATAAAAEVGLEEKLGAAAGALSGGQRRKLSVALAFVGNPSGGWEWKGES